MRTPSSPPPAEIAAALVLPAYAKTALANYVKLAQLVRLLWLRPQAVGMRFAGPDPQAVLAHYLASDEQAPLIIALERDVRAVFAAPAFQARLRKRPKGLMASALWVGRRVRLLRPVPAARQANFLVSAPTATRAAAFDTAMRRLLAKPAGRRPAIVGAQVRATRFTERHTTRDRDVVAAVFGSLANGLALVDAHAAGFPLFGLAPHVAIAGARHFTRTRGFERVRTIVDRALADPAFPAARLGTMFDFGWNAAMRLDDLDGAHRYLDQWQERCPDDPGHAIARGVLTAPDDPAAAVVHLVAAGAADGTAPANAVVLLAECLARLDDLDGAEAAVRRALPVALERDSAELLFALHNIYVRRGMAGDFLSGVFEREGALIGWDGYTVDGMTDLSLPVPGWGGRKVSVVMTAFNAAPFIATAVRGVLGQSHAAIELIVVDDASTDDTPAVLARLAAADPRVTVLRLPANVGTYAAKNRGIGQATGDFVALCDADDVWLRNHVAHHLATMREHRDAVASTSRWIRIDEDGIVESGPKGGHAGICPHAGFFRRSVFSKVGPFDAVRVGADREFMERVALHYGRDAVVAIDMVLTIGRRHGASLTSAGAGALGPLDRSPLRVRYWAAWNDWHLAALAAGKAPVMPDATEPRPFAAPAEILTSVGAPAGEIG